MERKLDRLLANSCGSGGGPSSGGSCDSGWTGSPDGTCVKVMTVAKTWIQAEANCRQSGAELGMKKYKNLINIYIFEAVS